MKARKKASLMLLCFLAAVFVPLFGSPVQDQPVLPLPPNIDGIYQLVVFKLGPGWRPDKTIWEQPGLSEHSGYMDKLVAAGILVLGGAIFDENGVNIIGEMMFLRAPTVNEARHILSSDPARKSGLYVIDSIKPVLLTHASWWPKQ